MNLIATIVEPRPPSFEKAKTAAMRTRTSHGGIAKR